MPSAGRRAVVASKRVLKTATLTVNPPAAAAGPTLSSLAFSPASVTGGNSSTGTVRLSAAAPAGGVSDGLSSPSASVSVPASVPVPAGQTSATFTATTRAVTTILRDETRHEIQ